MQTGPALRHHGARRVQLQHLTFGEGDAGVGEQRCKLDAHGQSAFHALGGREVNGLYQLQISLVALRDDPTLRLARGNRLTDQFCTLGGDNSLVRADLEEVLAAKIIERQGSIFIAGCGKTKVVQKRLQIGIAPLGIHQAVGDEGIFGQGRQFSVCLRDQIADASFNQVGLSHQVLLDSGLDLRLKRSVRPGANQQGNRQGERHREDGDLVGEAGVKPVSPPRVQAHWLHAQRSTIRTMAPSGA